MTSFIGIHLFFLRDKNEVQIRRVNFNLENINFLVHKSAMYKKPVN